VLATFLGLIPYHRQPMRVPAPILRSLLLLLVVFPLLADTPLLTPVPGPTPNSIGNPALATLGDGYLSAWPEGVTGSREVRAIRLGADARPIDARSFGVDSGVYVVGDLRLASGGDVVFVLWTTLTSAPAAVQTHLARVEGDGKVTRLPDVPIALSSIVDRIALAATANDLLIAYPTPAGAAVTLLRHDGSILQKDVPLATRAGVIQGLDLTANGNNGYLAAWTDTFDSRVRAMALPTSAIAARTLIPQTDIPDTPSTAAGPRIVTNGSAVLAVWTENTPDGRGIRTRSLSTSATPLAESQAVPEAVPNTIRVDVAPLGDGFAVTYFDVPHGATLVRLAADGTFVSRQLLDTVGANFSGLPIASHGNTAAVVWDDYRNTPAFNFQVRARAIAADGTPSIDQSLVSLNLPRIVPHAIFPTPTGWLAVWSEFAPAERVLIGRLDPAGRPLDGAGIHVSTPEHVASGVAAVSNGKDLLLVWRESGNDSARGTMWLLDTPLIDLFMGLPHAVRDVSSQSDLAVGWNGTEFLLAWRRITIPDIVASRVEPRGGELIDQVPFTVVPPLTGDAFADAQPKLAWNGSEWLVAWQRQWGPQFLTLPPFPPPVYDAVMTQRLSRELVLQGAAQMLTTTPDGFGDADAQLTGLTSSGGRWLVAFRRTDMTNDAAATTRIAADGTRLDPLGGSPLTWAGPGTLPFLGARPGGWYRVADHALDTLSLDGVATPPLNILPADAAPVTAASFDGPVPAMIYGEGQVTPQVHLITPPRRLPRR
jgi:hypothetical protein